MAQEIEYKFLVKSNDFKKDVFKSIHIIQGYLSSVPERTVRIRIKDNQAFITIKGLGDKSGLSRFEWEKEISEKDALNLLELCEKGIIEKTRHLVRAGKHVYEVDEFHGDNEGLIIAELEVSSIDEEFYKPEWLGSEVTGNNKYYNSMLMQVPFKMWK